MVTETLVIASSFEKIQLIGSLKYNIARGLHVFQSALKIIANSTTLAFRFEHRDPIEISVQAFRHSLNTGRVWKGRDFMAHKYLNCLSNANDIVGSCKGIAISGSLHPFSRYVLLHLVGPGRGTQNM